MRNTGGTIEAISLLPGEACELVAGIEAALASGEAFVYLVLRSEDGFTHRIEVHGSVRLGERVYAEVIR